MDRLITIEELKQLKERIEKEKATDYDYMRIFQMFSMDQKEPENEVLENKKNEEKPMQFVKKDQNSRAGFSNIIYLATLSLVTEICFLAVSFIIYK